MSFVNRIRKEAFTDEDLIKIRETELLFNQNRYGGSTVSKEEIEEDTRCRDILNDIKTQAENLLSDSVDLGKNLENLKNNLQNFNISGECNEDVQEIIIESEEGKVIFKITSP